MSKLIKEVAHLFPVILLTYDITQVWKIEVDTGPR